MITVRPRLRILILAGHGLVACSGTDAVGNPALSGEAGHSAGGTGVVASARGGAGAMSAAASGAGALAALAAGARGDAGSSGGAGGKAGAAGRESVAGAVGMAAGSSSGAGGSSGAAAEGPTPDSATRRRCTGTDPIECHFGGAPGNYDVSVVLGGAAAGETLVQAERARTLLPSLANVAGETKRFTFTVNVRQPEGEPLQDVPAGNPGLDLYFLGSSGRAPQLEAIGYAAAEKPFVLYIAGDSTVCDQATLDYGGWGQELPQHFDYPVSVANYADSGESSGSFLGSAKLFGAIEKLLAAQDWVLIQFGHNDKTVSAAAFHDNLTQMLKRVQAKGASPVLVTPVARAQFNGSDVAPQHINSTGANLPEIVKQVAAEQKVPLLDMTARTTRWLTEIGPDGWKKFHALGTDATHTNPAGAAVEAGFVRELIIEAKLTALVTRLR